MWKQLSSQSEDLAQRENSQRSVTSGALADMEKKKVIVIKQWSQPVRCVQNDQAFW